MNTARHYVHFQMVMLAYNLNCWLLLFQREEGIQADKLQHTIEGCLFMRVGSFAQPRI